MKTTKNALQEMQSDATVNIVVASFSVNRSLSLKYVGSQKRTEVLTIPVSIEISENLTICLLKSALILSMDLPVFFELISSIRG